MRYNKRGKQSKSFFSILCDMNRTKKQLNVKFKFSKMAVFQRYSVTS